MTPTASLDVLLGIALDMTASLTSGDRSRRLVDLVRQALPCDCVALLRLEGEDLVPIATHGLSADVLGRRFSRAEHPRLDIICSASGPTLFPADSPLPDPYDGLVEGDHDLHGHVHSCLGCPLVAEGELVGVLTLDALEPGAFDAIDPPFLSTLGALAGAALRTSDLIDALERHARHQRIVSRDLVREALQSRGAALIGTSAEMERVQRDIDVVARSDFPVLVTGETGTGKELVVRMLHEGSSRSDQPLVYVNCAALPESIAESELFGHERGAFTGATASRPGKFQMADGASLFLDEIGELPTHLQPKLLRALQEGEVQRVGRDAPLRVDVRVFAATNRDLDAEVAAGRFRADLLHRLDVCRIAVPPLREHRADIPLLAGHFCDRARRRVGTGPVRVGPEAQDALMRGLWPGNVRELENVISRAVVRAGARTPAGETVILTQADIGVEAATPAAETASAPVERSVPASLSDATRDFQRDAIRRALAASDGNWAQAARHLGLDRSNLHHLAVRLGLKIKGERRRAR